MPYSDLVTQKEAAAILNRSVSAVSRAIKDGRLEYADPITWMWSVELPELMRKQGYRDQITAHCAELAHRSEAIGADIHKMVGSKLEEQTAADELRAQLTALLDE